MTMQPLLTSNHLRDHSANALQGLIDGTSEALEVSTDQISTILLSYGGPTISIEYNHQTNRANYIYSAGMFTDDVVMRLDAYEVGRVESYLQTQGVEIELAH